MLIKHYRMFAAFSTGHSVKGLVNGRDFYLLKAVRFFMKLALVTCYSGSFLYLSDP
mgnify:CR=1 FL=1